MMKPSRQEQPKVIFFDAMGTLFGLRGSVGEVYARVAADEGVSVSAAALDRAFGQAFSTASPMAFPGVPASELPQHEYRWWEAIARQTFTQAEVIDQFENFPDFFSHLYNYFSSRTPWLVYPDTVPTLTHYQNQGIELGVISNFDSRLHQILAELRLKDYFSSVTISTEAGFAKPEAGIFELAIAKHQIHPHQAWHVGDSRKADYQGAIAAGLQGIWLKRDSL